MTRCFRDCVRAEDTNSGGRRHLVGSLVALALLVGSVRPARADEDPRKVQADALFQEGLKLHDKDKENEALEKFRKAYEIFPSPNALFWMAREEHLLGRGVDALRHYRAALDNPLLHPGNQKLAREYVAQLEKWHGRVTVTGPPGATVSVDNREVRLPMAEPIDVAAGTVVVRGERDGRRYEAAGLAIAGAAIVIDLRETATSSATGDNAASDSNAGTLPTTTPSDAEPSRDGAYPPARWLVPVGLGVAGLAALSAGVGFSLAASADSDDIEKLSTLTGSSGQSCTPGNALPQCSDLTRKRDERDDHRALATGFIAGGAAAIVAGGALFLLWPKSEPARRGSPFRPIVSPTFMGLQLQRSF